jgi:hypothetical protein
VGYDTACWEAREIVSEYKLNTWSLKQAILVEVDADSIPFARAGTHRRRWALSLWSTTNQRTDTVSSHHASCHPSSAGSVTGRRPPRHDVRGPVRAHEHTHESRLLLGKCRLGTCLVEGVSLLQTNTKLTQKSPSICVSLMLVPSNTPRKTNIPKRW